MELNVEKLAGAGRRTVGKMDAGDMAAMKLCLLSTGALAGLSLKNKFLRRLAGLACGVLAVGLAVPLTVQYLEQLRQDDGPAPEPSGEGEDTPGPHDPEDAPESAPEA